LKLKYDEPASNFVFNFNLRHYIVESLGVALVAYRAAPGEGKVGRCRLTPD